MQPNKSKIALVIGALYLGVSNSSYAASESFTITATTVADVTLVQNTALNYGSNIFTTAGGTCLMNAATPGSLAMLADFATDATATNYGNLSGSGCVNGAALGTPGVYTITGTTNSNVNITLNGVAHADYTFTPNSSAVVNYGGTTNATNDDAFVALSTAAPTVVRTASTTEAAATEVTDATLRFTLGGTLTVLNALTQDTPYANTFTVNVVY